MRYIATILVLIPGIFSLVSDPDALGIGLLVIFLLPLYMAWRNNVVGGIILIAVGALMLGFFFINLLGPGGIPGGVLGILSWVMFVVFPVAAGILFILAGKKGRTVDPGQISR
jgi:hypothetical protein